MTLGRHVWPLKAPNLLSGEGGPFSNAAPQAISAGPQSADFFFSSLNQIYQAPRFQEPLIKLSNVFETFLSFFFFASRLSEKGIFKASITQPHKSKLSHRLLRKPSLC